MLKGFKDFLMRGNVVDLAVAVVIGAAFGSVVTAFTDKIIKPLLDAITPPTVPGLGIPLVEGKPSAFIDISALITATINFVLVAVVVYFAIVMPMKKISERRKRGEESGPAEPTDVELLKEIRDLLAAQSNGGGGAHARTANDGLTGPMNAAALSDPGHANPGHAIPGHADPGRADGGGRSIGGVQRPGGPR
jgi:large conductance mechanosensitive channel